jgi:uncharacterized protein YdiU (UPF0061 family)
MAISGETIDYGPCAFMNAYNPNTVFSSIDRGGRYAYANQPGIATWNLTRLAECLLPLAPQADLERALAVFEPALHQEFPAALLRRLGLAPAGFERDGTLARALWTFLHESKAPFEQTLFDWRGGLASEQRAAASPSAAFYAQPAFRPVHAALEGFEPAPDAHLDHPYFARTSPCTMLIEDVEATWAPIADRDDWTIFNAKLSDIAIMAQAYGTRVG